jgi:ABC-type dipeptide/oligopeptide/nickel transport system permease subunit
MDSEKVIDRASPWSRYKEWKRRGRSSVLKPAKTKQGKWIRFFVLCGFAASLLLVAFFGYLAAPYDPLATDFAGKLSAPSAAHWFGTDNVGRDVLSRILYGASNSFFLTFLMVAIVSIVGTIIGVTAGYFGGILDTIIMRFTDILLAFPDSVFAIAVVGMMGPGLVNTVISLSLVWWTKYARVTRGMVSSIRTKDYITQARFGGARTPRILLRYVLPNIVSQVVIMATMDIGSMMLALAGLSFLGLSSQPPTPEWGYMLYEGKSYLQTAPWIMLFAGLAILITVIIFNLLGDSMRDILDPKEA